MENKEKYDKSELEEIKQDQSRQYLLAMYKIFILFSMWQVAVGGFLKKRVMIWFTFK